MREWRPGNNDVSGVSVKLDSGRMDELADSGRPSGRTVSVEILIVLLSFFYSKF